MSSPLRDVADAASESPMLRDVRDGLTRPEGHKTLPSKYFYDRRGSELFEEITRLPEYYLTRAERAILDRDAQPLIAHLRPATLVELGAGSAEKTRILIEAMLAARASTGDESPSYVPIDVSETFLEETAARLRRDYPALDVFPVIGDLSEELELPRLLPAPALFAFLGSTIGNFDERQAIGLLTRVREVMRPGDRFLLGADLHKDPARLHAAYNDARGVTAEFNRNVLRVINHELGADFGIDDFSHRAFYDSVQHRIEMHLVAARALSVQIPGIGCINFRSGESVRTEISCKYDRPRLEALLAAAGLILEQWLTDGDFALAVARA